MNQNPINESLANSDNQSDIDDDVVFQNLNYGNIFFIHMII